MLKSLQTNSTFICFTHTLLVNTLHLTFSFVDKLLKFFFNFFLFSLIKSDTILSTHQGFLMWVPVIFISLLLATFYINALKNSLIVGYFLKCFSFFSHSFYNTIYLASLSLSSPSALFFFIWNSLRFITRPFTVNFFDSLCKS